MNIPKAVICFLYASIITVEAFSSPLYKTKRFTFPAEEVEAEQLPWVVQQLSEDKIKCTGILISSNFAMLPKHCVDTYNKKNCLTIRFGNAVLPFVIRGKRLVSHPRNDIAIVELLEGVSINSPTLDKANYICPLNLNINSFFSAGFAGTNILKRANLSLFGFLCSGEIINKYVLRYQGIGEGGDSGAPLFYEADGEQYLLGILSSIQTFDGGLNFYEPLSRNVNFIENHINEDLPYSGIGSILDSMNNDDWENIPCEQSATSATSATVSILLFLTFLSMLHIHL